MRKPDPPFSYYGGKRRIADDVWQRLGNPKRYIEPFAGSLAMLLKRPHRRPYGDEVVNDLDGHITNVWRSIQQEPETVAEQLGRPIAELDLHAAARDLQREYDDLVEYLRESLDHYDPELAGLWLWGKCLWKGSGWPNGGKKRPNIQPRQILSPGRRGDRLEWLASLQNRLQHVTIMCGDWRRCVGSQAAREGKSAKERTPTAVFYDPPYGAEVRSDTSLYSEDSTTVADEVRAWCLEHGDRDDYRIALCGMRGEHDMPDSWDVMTWQTASTHTVEGDKRDECVWFSPGCQTVRQETLI